MVGFMALGGVLTDLSSVTHICLGEPHIPLVCDHYGLTRRCTKVCSVIMQGVQMCKCLFNSINRLLILKGSISIGGLCHHAWEMPIDVFKKHMLVRSPQC
jgi:hypothetical protein